MSDTAGCSPLEFEVLNNSIGEDDITWFLNGTTYSQSQLDSFLIDDELMKVLVFKSIYYITPVLSQFDIGESSSSS